MDKKVPRPEARNCLRLVLSLSFIALLSRTVIMPFAKMKRQSLEKEEKNYAYSCSSLSTVLTSAELGPAHELRIQMAQTVPAL